MPVHVLCMPVHVLCDYCVRMCVYCATTVRRLHTYCTTTARLLHDYCMTTVRLLYTYCATIVRRLHTYCTTIARLLHDYCATTAPGVLGALAQSAVSSPRFQLVAVNPHASLVCSLKLAHRPKRAGTPAHDDTSTGCRFTNSSAASIRTLCPQARERQRTWQRRLLHEASRRARRGAAPPAALRHAAPPPPPRAQHAQRRAAGMQRGAGEDTLTLLVCASRVASATP
jgi:hypothetical protein